MLGEVREVFRYCQSFCGWHDQPAARRTQHDFQGDVVMESANSHTVSAQGVP